MDSKQAGRQTRNRTCLTEGQEKPCNARIPLVVDVALEEKNQPKFELNLTFL